MSKPMLRLTYDADGAGRQCGKAIIANDEKALHNISAKIDLGHEIVNQWVSERGGKRISGGGDEGSFRIPFEAAKDVEELRSKYYEATDLNISVGIGKDLSEAGRSLLYAKATGKNKTVWYGPKVEKGIDKMREKVKAKTANQEEMKLADAYLEKSENMKCDLHKAEGEHGLYGAPDLKPGEKYHLASHSPTTGTLHYKGTVGSKKGLHSAADKRDQKHGAIMRHVVTVVPAPTTAPMVKYEHTCGLHKSDSDAAPVHPKDSDIVGHTQSKKPVHFRSEAFANTLKYTPQDHADAAKIHNDLGRFHQGKQGAFGSKERAKDPAHRDIHSKIADQHSRAAYQHSDPASELRSDSKAGMSKPEMYKSEHTHNLHKHEEGFHNGAADKEDKGFQNPDQEDNRTDDCAYCQDLDAQENADGSAGMHDCDACKEYDASQQNTGGIDTDDCPYCQESSEEDDCPYCQDTPDEAGGVDGCPYCESETVGEAQAGTPEGQDVDHICNCPNCPKHDATALGVQDMSAEQPDNCPQCQEMYGDAIEEQPDQTGQEDPNLQGHETAEEVLDLLDQKPGEGDQTPEAEAKKIDNTELPQGDEMEEGASVPENFGDKQKNNVSDAEKDMQNSDHECNCPDCPGSQGGEEGPIDRMASPDYQGTQGDADQMAQESGQNGELGQESGQDPMAEDGQDEPDMAGVLQGGLDDHAQEQKRAQVIDQVSQTLQGFKANKAFLEEAKDQSPGLYQSTIQMLKAMIELCKLLGLEPKMSSDAPQDPGAVAEATQSGAPDGPKAEGQSDPKAVG
jgi:hypothetical protein